MAAFRKIAGKGGYDRLSYVVNRAFNFLMALALLIPCLPFIIIISIVIKFLDGGKILYKGERLGLNKKPFAMYKFRTLIPSAERAIGANLLSRRLTEHKKLETPIGVFLRDTRLDELLQLFNVLRGNMDIVGPRPVRPIIYKRFCEYIKGYDKRFLVKPGIIGYAQIFTPHDTPKRIRAYVDHLFLKKKQVLIWDVFFVFYTFLFLIIKLSKQVWNFVFNYIFRAKILRLYKKKRLRERRFLKNAYAFFESKPEKKGKMIDINEEAVLIYSNNDFDPIEKCFSMKFEVVTTTRAGKSRKHTAHCKGEIYKKIEVPDNPYRYRFVVKFKPISRLNEYMVSQYFLSNSIISR